MTMILIGTLRSKKGVREGRWGGGLWCDGFDDGINQSVKHVARQLKQAGWTIKARRMHADGPLPPLTHIWAQSPE